MVKSPCPDLARARGGQLPRATLQGAGRCGGRIGCCSPRTRASLPRRPSPWRELSSCEVQPSALEPLTLVTLRWVEHRNRASPALHVFFDREAGGL